MKTLKILLLSVIAFAYVVSWAMQLSVGLTNKLCVFYKSAEILPLSFVRMGAIFIMLVLVLLLLVKRRNVIWCVFAVLFITELVSYAGACFVENSYTDDPKEIWVLAIDPNVTVQTTD